jgi:uncharacterized protein involved in response to NO
MVVVGMSAVALIAWIAVPVYPATGAVLVAAGALQLLRLGRWAGDRTATERLVLVLHVGYLFVPLGFLLTGASILGTSVPPSVGIHAWTAGAIGLMTLAVMTRATLGHTGQVLTASFATQFIYACAVVAALTRMAAPFDASPVLLHVSALAWVLAFGGFAAIYGPLLIGRRPA